MSLALIALGDRSVAIASDGAVMRQVNDGSLARVADDFKKFREVEPGVVLVLLGTTWLAEQLYPAIETFLKEHGGKRSTFQSLVDFLAANLPVYHAVHERLFPILPADARRCSAALAGLDRETGRSRLALFTDKDGADYRPAEGMTVLATGWISNEYEQLCRAYEYGVDGHAWAETMARIIAEKESEFITGKSYTLTIEWEPSPGVSAVAISRREAEWTAEAR
jgi:hypothetical protein